jgi:hypothetical protein
MAGYLDGFYYFWIMIVYKPGRSHLMVDALNRLPHQTEHVAVLDQTCDAHLFTL